LFSRRKKRERKDDKIFEKGKGPLKIAGARRGKKERSVKKRKIGAEYREIAIFRKVDESWGENRISRR
jgi:hypothetical protein